MNSVATLPGTPLRMHRLDAVPGFEYLPFGHKILLENLLRHESGAALALVAGERPVIDFWPSRVFLHDTNGVPVLTDIAALRDAIAAAGGDPRSVTPRLPAELTIDHSVAADVAGTPDAARRNVELEYRRNAERYRFLKWGASLDGFRVIPPGGGIMHQINLEYLARVVERRDGWAFPDTCVGTDSHTTMVNGLGVLAWGIGGIEAEAALLGQPISMVVPRAVGVELRGALGPGVTATDLVLAITARLREHGVVGALVEFTGAGARALPLAHRATIANMAPEYGATCGLFAVDDITLDYLRLTGRSPAHVAAVETYCKEQGLWAGSTTPRYDERLRIDLGDVQPALAGPRRPQDRVLLADVPAGVPAGGGTVAIAAITSCTNTSNPAVMVAAGLLARNARRRGLQAKPWVKTSLAPGSKAVTAYLERAGLTRYLDELGFQLVGHGCTTCIGNSGPLRPELAARAAPEHDLAAVLSGNRNFDGRIHNDVALNYLASPPLVVAYALAGTVDRDVLREPLGIGDGGAPVYLADVWPSDAEIAQVIAEQLTPDVFAAAYEGIFAGDERWRAVPAPAGTQFAWAAESTYLRPPPFFDGLPATPPGAADIRGARVLLTLGDSVTTDHISPAGRIPADSVAGRYLAAHGERDLDTYASRRGNFEVMVRGAFANPRLRDARGERVAGVYEAARAGTEPLVIVAGEQYGTGSSRDWAAKATALLGVRAVLARSFERIHRANLVQLGVLPVELPESLDADGPIDVLGVADAIPSGRVTIRSRRGTVEAIARVDTPREADYYRHGGILPYVYRQLLAA